MLKRLLQHPLTKGLDIDSPKTTELRRQIIRNKAFLRQIYQEWYLAIAASLPRSTEPVLEIGSGAGFLKVFVRSLITSEVIFCPGVDAVLDGMELPFKDGSLQGIVIVDVLHHLPRPRRFFAEAARCVKPGGVMVMIEPWVTRWSQLIYTRLHHEPFRVEDTKWEFPLSGPLSGANGALPYLIFVRDRLQFEAEFPMWQVTGIKPIMPFRYLVSGGVSLRALMPGFTFGFWRNIENLLRPWIGKLAMFAQIVLLRTG
jgi:SAM-dependent methyltransferase